ncbi:MAG: Clp protease ClpC [Bacteroidetes bacterium]|nr:Clp protease ClpC [Bacteroidota bacterium]
MDNRTKRSSEVFDSEVRIAIINSKTVALELLNNFITIEHLFLGMLRVEDAKFRNGITINWARIEGGVIQIVKRTNPPQERERQSYHSMPLLSSCENVLRAAVLGCHLSGRIKVTTQDLLLTIIKRKGPVKELLRKEGLNYNGIYSAYDNCKSKLPDVMVYRADVSPMQAFILQLRIFYYLYLK